MENITIYTKDEFQKIKKTSKMKIYNYCACPTICPHTSKYTKIANIIECDDCDFSKYNKVAVEYK